MINKKILLNAESFGFGPTSIVNILFPFFRQKFIHIGYIGRNHTLDLQHLLPYDAIYDLDKVRNINSVAKEYDCFFTALNFKRAEEVIQCGIPIGIFDPLAWYWQDLPEIIHHEQILYFTADFYGVRERLRNIGHRIVPSLTSSLKDCCRMKKIRRLNFQKMV